MVIIHIFIVVIKKIAASSVSLVFMLGNEIVVLHKTFFKGLPGINAFNININIYMYKL